MESTDHGASATRPVPPPGLRALGVAGLAEKVDDLHLRVLDLLGDLQEARGDALALRGAHASDLLEHLAGLRKV